MGYKNQSDTELQQKRSRKYVFEHEAFRTGDFDTHFVKDYYSPEILKKQAIEGAEIAALVALKQYLADQKILRTPIN